MEGIVFDIQRFSLHDGPGIRTTVFLKGCPLACLWCHNPESQRFEPELSFHRERCTECVPAAANGLRRLQAGPLAIPVDEAASSAACPHGSFTVTGKTMTVEEVMEDVIKDRPYYERSGGGMTLSGGEPMAQSDFSLALLRRAKAYGINTCLDTCGVTSRRRLAAVLPFVDLVLYDYKATDPFEHIALTGSSNVRILANLDALYRLGARIRLRCPLVPGVNDSAEHFAAIAALAKRYSALEGIEIMPYHDMGRGKTASIDRDFLLPDVPSASEDQKSSWLETLGEMGCDRAFIA